MGPLGAEACTGPGAFTTCCSTPSIPSVRSSRRRRKTPIAPLLLVRRPWCEPPRGGATWRRRLAIQNASCESPRLGVGESVDVARRPSGRQLVTRRAFSLVDTDGRRHRLRAYTDSRGVHIASPVPVDSREWRTRHGSRARRSPEGPYDHVRQLKIGCRGLTRVPRVPTQQWPLARELLTCLSWAAWALRSR
jgi:hypothetical protein